MGGVIRYITKNILVICKEVFPIKVEMITYLHTAYNSYRPSCFINCKNMSEVYLRLAVNMETSTDLL